MNTYIVLFRGINVGGHNIVRMADLKRWLTNAGFDKVQSYIQSGNVVLNAKAKSSSRLSEEISKLVQQQAGFKPDVMVLTAAELETMIAQNPYPTDDGKTLHFYILKSKAIQPNMDALQSLQAASESFELTDSVFYLHAPDGIGRSKLAAAVEKHLAVSVTARNWNTILKLQAMVVLAE